MPTLKLVNPPTKKGIYQVEMHVKSGQGSLAVNQSKLQQSELATKLGPYTVGTFAMFDDASKKWTGVEGAKFYTELATCLATGKKPTDCPPIKGVRFLGGVYRGIEQRGELAKITATSVLEKDLPLPKGVTSLAEIEIDEQGKVTKMLDQHRNVIDLSKGVGAIAATILAGAAFVSALAAAGFAIIKLGGVIAIGYVVFKLIRGLTGLVNWALGNMVDTKGKKSAGALVKVASFGFLALIAWLILSRRSEVPSTEQYLQESQRLKRIR